MNDQLTQSNQPDQQSQQTPVEGKSKIVAALLALFLGGLGIHKFYLGYTNAGIITLIIALFGFILLFIPNLIIAIIALIEFFIYIFTDDKKFHQKYVVNKCAWF